MVSEGSVCVTANATRQVLGNNEYQTSTSEFGSSGNMVETKNLRKKGDMIISIPFRPSDTSSNNRFAANVYKYLDKKKMNVRRLQLKSGNVDLDDEVDADADIDETTSQTCSYLSSTVGSAVSNSIKSANNLLSGKSNNIINNNNSNSTENILITEASTLIWSSSSFKHKHLYLQQQQQKLIDERIPKMSKGSRRLLGYNIISSRTKHFKLNNRSDSNSNMLKDDEEDGYDIIYDSSNAPSSSASSKHNPSVTKSHSSNSADSHKHTYSAR